MLDKKSQQARAALDRMTVNGTTATEQAMSGYTPGVWSQKMLQQLKDASVYGPSVGMPPQFFAPPAKTSFTIPYTDFRTMPVSNAGELLDAIKVRARLEGIESFESFTIAVMGDHVTVRCIVKPAMVEPPSKFGGVDSDMMARWSAAASIGLSAQIDRDILDAIGIREHHPFGKPQCEK